MATKKAARAVVEKVEQAEQVSPLRCWRCDKMLSEEAAPGTVVRCMRCGAKSRVLN